MTQPTFIVRHWRGQQPLPESWFWTGVILAVLSTPLVEGGVWVVERSSSLGLMALEWLAVLIFLAGIRVWAIVGLWRSACRHVERRGSAKWAEAAKAFLCVLVVAYLVRVPEIAPGLIEYGSLAVGHDPLGEPAKMTYEAGGRLKLTGVITAGSARKFRQMAEARSDLREIELESSGGRTFEALRIAQYVRLKHLNSIVQKECSSACTLILIAGKIRSARPSADIGFHQPEFPGWSENMRRRATVVINAEYSAAGMGPDFLIQVASTPAAKLWRPSFEELVRDGVLNGMSGGGSASSN